MLQDTRYLHGIQLFNERSYFECHEVLEEVWTPMRGPHRLFLQSLIHCAVALYHYEHGNPEGARRQFRKALKKLAGYLPEYAGLDTLTFYNDALAWRDAIIVNRPLPECRLMNLTPALQSQMQP